MEKIRYVTRDNTPVWLEQGQAYLFSRPDNPWDIIAAFVEGGGGSILKISSAVLSHKEIWDKVYQVSELDVPDCGIIHTTNLEEEKLYRFWDNDDVETIYSKFRGMDGKFYIDAEGNLWDNCGAIDASELGQ